MNLERPAPAAFRRREFRAPHKRRRLLVRLAGPFLGAVALVGLPAAVAGWILTSDAFALRAVEVEGVERVASGWVERSLRPLAGRHLLWLRLPEIERRLASHPWVRDVRVRKELPDKLVVVVEERRPVALLRRGAELAWVDRDGEVIAAFRPELGAADLPLLQGGRSPDELARALEMIERWAGLRPGDAGALSEVEVLGGGDYRVFSGSLPFPVVVSHDRLEPGLERLERLLPEVRRRYPAVEQVDLRYSQQIVIQPAAWPREEQG